MKTDKELTTTPLLSPKYYPLIRTELRKWWKKNKRIFPWRESNDPYHLFVAEFMLQKTQVAKVEQIYLEFIKSYPNVKSLAAASTQKLTKIFSWLGLVKRVDFIKKSAKIIIKDFGGKIPRKSDDLLRLPGVGRYTANAILCFGYNQAHPVIDTTTARVLKRLFGFATMKSAWEDPITWDIATEFLDIKEPKEHNYALIDLAALICVSQNPLCEKCPLLKPCVYARRHNYL